MKELNTKEMRVVTGGMNKTELVKAIAGKAKLKLEEEAATEENAV